MKRDQSGERAAVRRLLDHLAKDGWAVKGVLDGGDEIVKTDTTDAVLEVVFAVDEASIRIVKGRAKDGPTHGVLIVLGNADDGSEVVSDWSYSKDDADGFNATMDMFLDAENR